MSRNFARHEQFLRIFTILDVLGKASQPLDDQSLIATLKERLGLSRLSPRTLRRDCEFLASCGYPIDHVPIPGGRKFGWHLAKDGAGVRRIPAEPLTLLEMVAFMVARDLLRGFEGTVLWTGIEALRHKIERAMPAGLMQQFEDTKRSFHVRQIDPARYAARPRLLSTLSAAITDNREIDIEERPTTGHDPIRHHVQPHCLVIHPPRVELLAFPAGQIDGSPLFIDIERIDKVVPRDVTFAPRPFDIVALLAEKTP